MRTLPASQAAPIVNRHRAAYAAVLAFAVFVAAAVLAGFALPAAPASAANVSVTQCNNIGPSAEGATTGMTCSVTVVNTIAAGKTSSTVTLIRQCSLGPCPPGNGTFTTTSADLVTSVNQCNGSDNDAAHPITCTATITNNISADTPGAVPVTPATVNQCVGSGGGGGGTVSCDPFPATTTNATITQCNGSANGGGATVACTVGTASVVSPAIALTVNQCNGTGNPGGSTVTCRTSIITNIVAAATAAPSVTASATVVPTATGSASATATVSPTAPASSGATATGSGATATGSASVAGTGAGTSAATPQVSRVPAGGVQTGGGSTSGFRNTGLLMLGVGLLAAAAVGTLLRRRSAGGASHIRR